MLLQSSSPAVFCDSPIYPISRSIASVVMKRPFGAKPVGRCTRLKNWTAANRRSGRAVFTSERGARIVQHDALDLRLHVVRYTKRTSRPAQPMSACGGKADITWTCADVRF